MEAIAPEPVGNLVTLMGYAKVHSKMLDHKAPLIRAPLPPIPCWDDDEVSLLTCDLED